MTVPWTLEQWVLPYLLLSYLLFLYVRSYGSNMENNEKWCARCECVVPEEHTHQGTTYNRKYRDKRLVKLAQQPICEDCKAQGIINAKQLECHHIVKPTTAATSIERDRLLLSLSNMMVLCKTHHMIRSARGE